MRTDIMKSLTLNSHHLTLLLKESAAKWNKLVNSFFLIHFLVHLLPFTPSLSFSLSVSIILLNALSAPWPHAAPGSPLNLHISETSCCHLCNDCRKAAYLFICFQVDFPRFTSLIFLSICSSQDLLTPICSYTVSVTQLRAHLNCKSRCCES